MRRYEYRYFNGSAWTADVAAGGLRGVDAIGAGPTPQPPSKAMAMASLVLGVVSLFLAWIPFVFVAGAICGVLAIVFGIVARRRRSALRSDGGAATAGAICGFLGVLLCSVGVVFTVAVVREVDRFENPQPHEANVLACDLAGRTVTATVGITNLGDESGGFTVTVDVIDASHGRVIRTVHVPVDSVDPGDTATASRERTVNASRVECQIRDVTGPLPFGLSLS